MSATYIYGVLTVTAVHMHMQYNSQPKIHFLSKAALRILPPLESPSKILFLQKFLTISV